MERKKMRTKENDSQKAVKPPLELEQAKEQFARAWQEFSPLGIVQERPFASLGTAFAAGFGLNMLGASRVAPPAMATMAQIASIVAQLAPLIGQRARSSDG